eukprot:5818876-Amphidinium_carterae.1
MGGYRAYAGYLTQAKLKHVELGFVWTDELALIAKRTIRSCERGLGPAKQTLPLDLPALKFDFDPNP